MTFNRKLTCEALEDRCMLAAFQSDDFNSLAINGSLWNAVDPLGDASFTTNGTHLRISVATGTAHDPATGSNTSPRIMQTIDNTNFEIAVKFDTSPIAGAYSGILVQQDIDDYLRYEFRRDTAGLSTWAFDSRSGVAIPAGNAAVVDSQSLYLRVTRSGNQWTHAFSTNGTAWTVVDTLTRSMNVASAGLFVGNAAGLGTPYYETSIDYAFETASPIVPEDGNLAIVPPTIDLWYGKDYAFGVLGNPQKWVNLLGNVSDPDGMTSLAYSLNAGASQPLSMGPNSTRLVNPGDFNVEIDRSLLATGWNTVVVTATDSLGNQSSESIYVNYTDNNVWPHAYTAQWGNVSKISAGGDIVDGRWELTAQGVRAVQPGYDRVIALGNQYLSDYEVQVPITMNQFNSGDSALGIAVRWKGHYEDPFQPNVAWWPLGGIGWFRFNGLEIIGNGGALIDRLETFSMNVGVTYIFRMRVESNPGSTATYSLKVWEQGTAEPTNWMVSGSGIAGELDAGSVLLLTHRFDATFGDVTITPITDGVLPTINANGTPFSNHITVDASASEPVTWEVNYGLTPSYELGTKRVAVPTASASLPLTGLAPQTTYYVRVVGTDVSGEASAPTSLILQTTAVDNTPPVLSNVQPTPQSTAIAVAATTNELATLQIRYGLTPSYELGTTAPSALATNHNLSVSALTSQTTYYLQVVATDPSGNSSTQDLVVATTAPNAGTSDQFDGTTLNTALWNFVNPQNDGTVSVNNGQLNLSVPAGVAHDVWTTGIAAPHVLQTISNTDFAIEVKFDSLPVGAYAMQGLLVKASNGDLLRFDFYSPSNTGLRIFAASFTGSTVNVRGNLNITPPATGQPLYMRLSRVGNLWTQQYSYDGAAWTTAASFSYTLPVNAVGLFAGNAGPSPAYTAKVDWFQAGPDNTAPVISNLQTSAQGTSILTTATTNELATWRIRYGLTPSYELGTVGPTALATSHNLSVDSLNPQTTYYLQVVATDAAGNSSTQDLVVATTAVDTTPPVLSNVQPTPQPTSIAVAAATNELATLQIRYGLTPSYELGTTAPSALATNHNLSVTALTSQTTYYLQVVATDPSGNSSTQDLVVATTAPNAGTSDQFDGTTLNTALWNFVNPQNDGTVSVNNGQLNLSVPAGVAHDVWTTGIAAPHVLQTISNTDFAIEVKFDSLPVGAYAMQGLLVKASNGDLLRFDFYSPSNTGLRIFAASFTGSTVNVRGNLNITPPATGQPLYMRLSRVGNLWTQQYSYDGAAWTTAATFSYTLPVNAVGLFAGNAGPSPAYTAKVDWFQAGPDNTAPVISNLQTTAQGTSILTTATTNELATWRIRYGLTPSYELGTVGPTALATSHNLSVDSLTPQTTYYLQVVATDAAGNSSTQDLVVATTAVDTTPPVLSNVQPTPQPTSIAVAAATNELATLQIRYGLTPSYELGTTAPSALATNHNLSVTALTSQTTYYLQVVATDPSGNSSTQDLVVATTAPNAGTSDQFDGTTLNTALWNFVNPQNDGTVSVNNGQLNLSVPAGVAHDVWTTGIAAPHVLQTISNTDFAIEVKFDSLPVGAYAMQGLLVKASNGDLLRFDFYSPSNTGLRIFAASFTGSSVNVRGNLNITPPAAGQPLYMRLSRVGNLWTQQYSYDGAAWTTAASFSYTLPVNAVGLFAGNAGPSPAYTAKVDWFVTSTA